MVGGKYPLVGYSSGGVSGDDNRSFSSEVLAAIDLLDKLQKDGIHPRKCTFLHCLSPPFYGHKYVFQSVWMGEWISRVANPNRNLLGLSTLHRASISRVSKSNEQCDRNPMFRPCIVIQLRTGFRVDGFWSSPCFVARTNHPHAVQNLRYSKIQPENCFFSRNAVYRRSQ